ncbi:hypothetical protein E0198_001200 [Clavispora lusitaniae]|nr:hypothetical protein E0198_001200 [Clavispora lusitaniae]
MSQNIPKIHSPVPYTLYRASLVHTPKLGELEILPDMLVGVDSKGVIDCLEPASGSSNPQELPRFKGKQMRYVDLHGTPCQFLVPGFIDTHIHAPQYPNIGIGSELPLLKWLEKHTFPLETQFTDENPDKMAAFGREIWLPSALISHLPTVQRPHCNPDFPHYEESYEECVESMETLIDHCNKLNCGKSDFAVKAIITPRFALSCTRELMTKLGSLAKEHKLPIQTHISENKDEIRLVRENFPECENYASVYDKHSLLGPSTIMAHSIHLSSDERELFRKSGCSISHCPPSNSFLTSGEAPVHRYLYEDKINVSLGTDLSGGYEQSILGVARSAIMVSHHLAMHTENNNVRVSIAEALYMATMGGARACGLGDQVGSFAVGKTFDAQLIDLDAPGTNVDVFAFQKPNKPEDDDYKEKLVHLVYRWVFSGDDRNCVRVWCNGRTVVNKENQWVYIERESKE